MSNRTPYFKIANTHPVKRHLKHLATLKDPKAISASLKYAPEAVTKRICDSALNILRGDIILNPKQRKAFHKHRTLINLLIDKKKSIKLKHTRLTQKGGGAALLSILLPLVLSTFGSLIFGKK